MLCVGGKLLKHTLVAVVLLCSTVLAPILLLLRRQVGEPWEAVLSVLGLGLLTVGCAAFLGAALSRAFDKSSCTALQHRLILASAWVLNPVLVAEIAIAAGTDTSPVPVGWWSGLPLGLALSLLSGCRRLNEGDPEWADEGCSLTLCTHWFFSRLVFVGLPMLLVSLQVDLYLPQASMLPEGAVIGLFVCGGCILISAKFCTMCACLASQKFAQAIVLVLLLSADWVSSLHILRLVGDDYKTGMLLSFLLASGVILTRSSLSRMQLRPRWTRALAQRRARQVAAGRDLDVELGGASVNGGAGDAAGARLSSPPGASQDAFHETMLVVLFLCGIRMAAVRGVPVVAAAPAECPTAEPAVGAPGVQKAAAGAALQPESPVPPLEAVGGAELGPDASSVLPSLDISGDDRVCVVCQDEIRPGDRVRPLPKCSHVFHAASGFCRKACLESWARTMREGATKISELTADDDSTAGSSSGSRPSAAAGAAERRQARPRARPPAGGRTGRPVQRGTSNQVAALRMTLNVTDPMAQAALDVAGGGAAVAAHILLEHRGVLDGMSDRLLPPAVPVGVAEAVVEGNPNLAGAEAALRRQLAGLYDTGSLRRLPWSDLQAAAQAEVFKKLLEDVSRRLEQAS
ncbi:unnamed protein product [Polarella glacialis]|uniref:RING-type domain-containing protein n=1 Tax=Polarella glacialis TaxID=89957 RepID=A0A813LSH9_POLGL|nr:unnamed protein product [Polarella glacialis]